MIGQPCAGRRSVRNQMSCREGTIMLRKLSVLGLTLGVLTLAAPGAQAQDQYGAIALSPSSNALGWSYGMGSRAHAEKAAQNKCSQHAGDCRVVTWFRNSCGAVALGGGRWGASSGNTRAIAESKAANACGNSCSVARWVCSGA